MSVEELSNKELAILNKLSERTTDLEFNQGTLVRFLRARNFDIKKAEEMLRATVVWRKETEGRYFGSSYEIWEPPSELTNGFDVYYCGRDAEGRPVYYAPLGIWASARELFEKGMEDDCLRFAGKSMDHIVNQMLLKTKHQNFVCIVDNRGVTFAKAWYEAQNYQGIQDLIRLFREYEANFPETLHKAYLINTPSVFYWGFNIIKPFMTKHTLSKISFFTDDQSEWLPVLQQNIPIEAIPPQFGGTSELKPMWPLEKVNLNDNENDTEGCDSKVLL